MVECMAGAVPLSKTKLFRVDQILRCEKAVKPLINNLFKYFPKYWEDRYGPPVIKILLKTDEPL